MSLAENLRSGAKLITMSRFAVHSFGDDVCRGTCKQPRDLETRGKVNARSRTYTYETDVS